MNKPAVEQPTMESVILKHRGAFRWEGVERTEYKSPVSDWEGHWQGVSRTELISEPSTPALPFHVRYFEIEPGGFSSHERHEHEHVVLVVTGNGTVQLDETSNPIGEGDVVRVRSWQPHQFRADADRPLGFYCIVAAERDRPVLSVGGHGSACELPDG